MVTGTIMLPLTTLTVMGLGDPLPMLFRVKLMVPGIVPDVGVTVNEPGGTPGVVTVAVKLPEPATLLVPVWPQVRVWVDGDTVNAAGVAAGRASPAGPATLITDDDSIARFSESVTITWLDPQPLCVTRKLPPLTVTTEGDTDKYWGNGDTTVYGGVPP